MVAKGEALASQAITQLAETMPERIGKGSRKPSENLEVERGRDDLRTTAIRDMLERGIGLTPLDGGVKSSTPVINVPGTRRRVEVVRTVAPTVEVGNTFTTTIVEVWRHQKDDSTPIIQITGKVDHDGNVTNEHVSDPFIEMRTRTHQDRDWGRAFDNVLIEAGEAMDIVAANTTPDHAHIEGPVSNGDLIAEYESTRLDMYEDFDTHLQEITVARKENGEQPQLAAFKDWLKLKDAEAEVALHTMGRSGELAGATKRLEDAQKKIDSTVETGSATRTYYPFTYKSELAKLDKFAAAVYPTELELLVAKTMPSETAIDEAEPVASVNIPRSEIIAKRNVIKTLKERQKAIANGELEVKPLPQSA